MNSPALIGSSLAGQRIDANAFDRRLVDAVFVTQRELRSPGCAPKSCHGQNTDAREAFVLLPERPRGRGVLFSSESLKALTPIWTCTRAVRLVPILGIVGRLRRQAALRAPPSRRETPPGKALQRPLGKVLALRDPCTLIRRPARHGPRSASPAAESTYGCQSAKKRRPA